MTVGNVVQSPHVQFSSMFSSMFSSCCHLPAVSPGGLRWGFFFFGRDGWLISLRFVFGAWGGSLGASVRANVRVCLAGSGRFYLECTVGSVQFNVQFKGCSKFNGWSWHHCDISVPSQPICVPTHFLSRVFFSCCFGNQGEIPDWGYGTLKRMYQMWLLYFLVLFWNLVCSLASIGCSNCESTGSQAVSVLWLYGNLLGRAALRCALLPAGSLALHRQ